MFIGVFLATLVTLEGRPSQAVPKLKQVVLIALFGLSLLVKCYNHNGISLLSRLVVLNHPKISFCRSGFLLL